jgi:uncharacterized repeat protein (TIGR01451 family)
MARIAMVLLAVCAASVAQAQNYEVAWWTVDGGGTTTAAAGTYTLGATAGQPDAGGPFAGGTYLLSAGFWTVAGGGGGVPQANLGITKTDGVSTVNPGSFVQYTIVASNAGPSAVTGATVSDVPPGLLGGVFWNCTASAGSSCPNGSAGPINASVDLAVGGTATFSLRGFLSAVASGALVNSAAVTAPGGVLDPNPGDNVATDTDTIVRVAEGELAHGSVVRADLASVGGTLDVDLYRIRTQPFSSYEVVLDETSGDIGASEGPALELVLSNGTTTIRDSEPVGNGPARSLRFQNGTSTVSDNQLVLVRSGQCLTSCGADDVYRLRVRETTASIPRFNNASQTTVLILQNVTDEPIQAMVYAWSASGAQLGFQGTALQPHALWLLDTGSVAPGATGALTIAHDGPYGGLAGKAVALEAATGFSFDSPLVWRSR